MKKQILNLGKALNKTEQRSINGGVIRCDDIWYPGQSLPGQCPTGLCCNSNGHCAIFDEELNICPSYIPGS